MDQCARSIFRPRAIPSWYQGPSLPKASNHQPCLTPIVRLRQGQASPSGGSTTTSSSSSSSPSCTAMDNSNSSNDNYNKSPYYVDEESFDEENLPTVLFVPERHYDDDTLLISSSTNTREQSNLSAWSLLAPRFTSRSEFEEHNNYNNYY